MVVLQLVRERVPDIPVLFLETGYHFAEVYRYRDEMTARYGLNLVNVMPLETVAQQEVEVRVVVPVAARSMLQAAKGRSAVCGARKLRRLVHGLRRVQSPTRANLRVIDQFPLPSGKQLAKISPLASWTDKDVWAFAREQRHSAADRSTISATPALAASRAPRFRPGPATRAPDAGLDANSNAAFISPRRTDVWKSCSDSSSRLPSR